MLKQKAEEDAMTLSLDLGVEFPNDKADIEQKIKILEENYCKLYEHYLRNAPCDPAASKLLADKQRELMESYPAREKELIKLQEMVKELKNDPELAASGK